MVKGKKAIKRPKGKDADRRIAVPAAMSYSRRAGPARISSSGGTTLIKHRERFGDVDGSATTNSSWFRIQPGRSTMFPWLFKVAGSFEMYRFRKLKFIYTAACPSSTVGVLTLFVDYDPYDTAVLAVNAANNEGAVQTSPWASVEVVVPPERLMKRRNWFVRTLSPADEQDIRESDFGRLWFFTEYATVIRLGTIHVEYEVELIAPHMLPEGPVSGSLEADSPTTAAPFTGYAVDDTSTLPLSVTDAVLSRFKVGQAGKYLINLLAEGTNIGAPTLAVLAGAAANIKLVTDVLDAAAGRNSTYLVELLDTNPGHTSDLDLTYASATTFTDLAMRVAKWHMY